jgi:hypothetical protein
MKGENWNVFVFGTTGEIMMYEKKFIYYVKFLVFLTLTDPCQTVREDEKLMT